MYTLSIITPISAPPDRCFDLARSIDAHLHTSAHTSERAVAGRTTGLIALHETVTWQARHFLLPQSFTAQITAFNRPHSFQDRMLRGPFKHFEHDHLFQPDPQNPNLTFMTDTLRFAAPLGPLGLLAERTFLAPYLRRFLTRRASSLKALAESNAWQKFLPPHSADPH